MTDAADTEATRERLRLLAHELRSPVAALAALCAAAPTVVDESSRRRLVALAVAAARDVDRLVTDPEPASVRSRRVDLAALVSGFAGPAVEIRVASPAAVDGDPTRLRQAVANLVANGLRHGSHVVVTVGEDGAGAVIEVADDGPGVQSGVDPFARGASTAGSTGYGLWLARTVAEAHGGSLELVPAGGPGARFRLALPSASAGR
jgi:signal transduction histidine kinase